MDKEFLVKAMNDVRKKQKAKAKDKKRVEAQVAKI